MLLVIIRAKKLLEHFTKKNYNKQNKEFRIEIAIKRKGDKLYVKWKSYKDSFHC